MPECSLTHHYIEKAMVVPYSLIGKETFVVCRWHYPAYPALPWVMKPYPENTHTTDQQKMYNFRQSRARMVVENAFGRLKGRWRCLLKQPDCKLENVTQVVAACVVLHNICEMFGDHCLPEWTHNQDNPPIPSPCKMHPTFTMPSCVMSRANYYAVYVLCYAHTNVVHLQ